MCNILQSNYITGINRGTRYENYLSLRDYTKMDLKKKYRVVLMTVFCSEKGSVVEFCEENKGPPFPHPPPRKNCSILQIFRFQKIILHNGSNQLVIQYHMINRPI